MTQIDTKLNLGASYSPATAESAGEGRAMTETDAATLKRLLLSDKDALARQRDLIDLHKRLVGQMGKIGNGLGEAQAKKAAEDRAALEERLDRMTEAVDRMEGALRIEYAPMIGAAIEAAMAERVPPAPRRAGWLASGLAAGLVLGLALGVAFAGDMKNYALNTASWFSESGQN